MAELPAHPKVKARAESNDTLTAFLGYSRDLVGSPPREQKTPPSPIDPGSERLVMRLVACWNLLSQCDSRRKNIVILGRTEKMVRVKHPAIPHPSCHEFDRRTEVRPCYEARMLSDQSPSKQDAA